MALKQKGQVLMFSDADLSILKNTFADNDDRLYVVRKVLLQFPLDDAERALFKGTMNDAVYEVLKKRIFPEIDPDSPLFQIGDFYQSLTNDLGSKGVEEMAPRFLAKELEYDYLEQQFVVLKDIDQAPPPVIILDRMKGLKGKSELEKYVQTTARNYLLGYIDSMLMHIKTLAGQKEESLEDAKARLTKDSNK